MRTSPQKSKQEIASVISTRQKVFIYSCLIPIFGTIPALMALISDRGSKQLKNVAQVSLITALVWLAGYAALGESNQISQELLKATLSSAYFVLNVYLMWRLAQGKKVALPHLPKSN